MALSLLASYALITDATYPTLNISHGMWDDQRGLVCCSDTGSTEVGALWCVKLDGKAFRLGKRGLTIDGIGWGQDDTLWLTNGNIISAQRLAPWATWVGAWSTGIEPLSGFNTIKSFARMTNVPTAARLFLTFDGNDVLRWDGSTGLSSVEKVITTGNAGPGRIFPADLTGGKSLWWLVDCGSGRRYQYNANTQLEVSGTRSIFGGPVTLASYSRRHDVFVCTLTASPTTLRVYANQIQASAIATPVFSPSEVRVGRRYTVSTTVTGSVGEACPNRVVTFSAGGVGEFPDPSVLTNASGVASTEWRAPYVATSGTLNALLTE